MPLLILQTNQTLSDVVRTELIESLTELVARTLGKPRDYVQIVLRPDTVMAFAGTEDPTAFVELKSLGLPVDQPKPLSAEICQLLQTKLGIAPDRVFLNFFDLPRTHWGWNGRTFG